MLWPWVYKNVPISEEWDNTSSTKDVHLCLFYNILKGHINQTYELEDIDFTVRSTKSENSIRDYKSQMCMLRWLTYATPNQVILLQMDHIVVPYPVEPFYKYFVPSSIIQIQT